MENKPNIGEAAQIIEGNAVGVGKDILWNAQEAATESVQIQDPGEGSAVVLRHFFFKDSPRHPAMPPPTKTEIFGQFKNLIFTQLWADGLRPREDRKIEIYRLRDARKSSKVLFAEMIKNHADFVIMCLAEPKKGMLLNERPNIAQ